MNLLLRAGHAVLFCVFACGAIVVQAQQAPGTSQQEFREVKVAESAFSRGDPLPPWAEPVGMPAPDRGKAVVVRLADTQLRVGDTPAYFVNRAIQVNEAASLGRIGQFPLHFVPEYQRLRLHSVRLLRGAEVLDKTQSANIRFLQRETGLESGVYSGAVTALLLLDDVRIHDTLHLMFSVEGENPVFGNTYSQFASWDLVDAVLYRRVVLTHPVGRKIAWRMMGDSREHRVRPEVTEREGLRRLQFEERDLAAVDIEEQLPAAYLPWRAIQFSEYQDWSKVASWAAQMFQVGGPLPAAAQSAVDQLRASPTRDARISGALQWVQSEIRYFSVALGESSHRPYPPATVVERRYGDCKDKSLLLIAMLRALGVEARPALVSLSSRHGLDRYLPTPVVFDHVVVQVESDGSTYYIDPARLGQRGALGRMGQALEGADVLVVHPDTTAFTRIASANIAELVRNEVAEKLTVSKLAGEGTLEARQTYYGVSAESMRLSLRQSSADQLQKFVLGPYERRYPGIVLLGEPSVSDDPENNRLTVASRFTIPKTGLPDRGNWLVPFYPRNFVGAIPLPQALTRRLPLAMASHPYEARYSLEVIWPENVSALTDPTTNLLDNKHFSAESTRSFRGNRAKVDLVLRTKEASVQPRDLRALFEDVRRVDRLVQGYVMISKADIKDSAVFGLVRQTLQEQIRGRMQQTVNQTTQTMQRGNLQPEDLAETYCTRAEALADLGSPAEGLKDAQEAVRLAPSLPRVYQCRGNVLFANGDFAAAVSDYSKGVALGGPDFEKLYRRGHARFYLGKFEEAAADFTQASAIKSAGGDGLYADLWLSWTLKRLGKPLSPALVQRAQQDPRGAWPRPALAMFAGLLTPDEMLASVNSKQGDDKEMTLAEAWFYLGQYHAARNDFASARDAFQKARDKGITVYIEHVAAGFELQRLAAK